MIERCADCGANIALVGRSHRCAPKNTPEASGTAREAPGGPALVEGRQAGPSRNAQGGALPASRSGAERGEAELSSRLNSNPAAKATKGKVRSAGKSRDSRKITVNPPEGVASRLGAGRTAQDRGLASPAAVAIPTRGRPRKPDGAPVSRATQYRRKAEAKR